MDRIQTLVAELHSKGVSVYQVVNGEMYVSIEAFFFVCRSLLDSRDAAQASGSSENTTLQEAAVKISNAKKESERIKKSRNRWRVCTIVLLLSAAVGIYFMWSSTQPTGPVYTDMTASTKANVTVRATTTTSISPVQFTNGHIYKKPSDECLCPLTIKTAAYESAYIYLDSQSDRANDMSFIVKAGESAKVFVPLGEYEIYFATGDTWYGTKYHFGEDTRYGKCDDLFDISYDGESYLGWTLELYEQYNGNLNTDDIPESAFPG